MTTDDHLCNNRHRILAVLQSLGAEPDSAEVAEVFQAVGEIEADLLDSRIHAERLGNAAIAHVRDEARQALAYRDAAEASRDAAWERAIRSLDRFGLDGVEAVIADCHHLLDAESNPPHLPPSDEESNRPKDWSEVRQRLRDAGADRWDEQRSWREVGAVEADLNGGGGSSNSDAGISVSPESVIRDRDAGDEDPSESLADFDRRCQHEQDGRDGVEGPL